MRISCACAASGTASASSGGQQDAQSSHDVSSLHAFFCETCVRPPRRLGPCNDVGKFVSVARATTEERQNGRTAAVRHHGRRVLSQRRRPLRSLDPRRPRRRRHQGGSPGKGDYARDWGPPFAHGTSTLFHVLNHNKRGLALDLRDGVTVRAAEGLHPRARRRGDPEHAARRDRQARARRAGAARRKARADLLRSRRLWPHRAAARAAGLRSADAGAWRHHERHRRRRRRAGARRRVDRRPGRRHVGRDGNSGGAQPPPRHRRGLPRHRRRCSRPRSAGWRRISAAISRAARCAARSARASPRSCRIRRSRPPTATSWWRPATTICSRALCGAIERAELVRDERFATNSKRVENRRVLIPMLEDIFRAQAERRNGWRGSTRPACRPRRSRTSRR